MVLTGGDFARVEPGKERRMVDGYLEA